MDLTNLSVIPDAPRVSGNTYPKNWDWKILETTQVFTRGMKKVISRSDIDSAFGSAESTTKDSDASSEVLLFLITFNLDTCQNSIPVG